MPCSYACMRVLGQGGAIRGPRPAAPAAQLNYILIIKKNLDLLLNKAQGL